MIKNAIRGLVVVAVLIAPLTGMTVAQETLSIADMKLRVAKAQVKGKEVVIKLEPRTKILVGKGPRPFEFSDSTKLSGRIKEIREDDFVFSSTSQATGEVTAVIQYYDVVSINQPSGFEKAFKRIGKYAAYGASVIVVIPLYGVLALMGDLPSC